MRELFLPAFFVTLHLMIILLAADAPIVGCLFWSVIIAGYRQIILFMIINWLSDFRFNCLCFEYLCEVRLKTFCKQLFFKGKILQSPCSLTFYQIIPEGLKCIKSLLKICYQITLSIICFNGEQQHVSRKPCHIQSNFDTCICV